MRICERGKVNLSSGATDESWCLDIAFSKNAVWEESVVARPNVRVKPAPTVGRAGPAGENVPRTAGRARVARRWGSA